MLFPLQKIPILVDPKRISVVLKSEEQKKKKKKRGVLSSFCNFSCFQFQFSIPSLFRFSYFSAHFPLFPSSIQRGCVLRAVLKMCLSETCFRLALCAFLKSVPFSNIRLALCKLRYLRLYQNRMLRGHNWVHFAHRL